MELSRLVKAVLSVTVGLCILFVLTSCGGKAENEAAVTEEYEAVSEIVLPDIGI